MRTSQLTIDAPEHGLQAEITFDARTAAYEEPRQTRYNDVRLQFDVTRATQFGDWSGSIRTGEDTLTLDDHTVWGCKDRSWGVRPVGAPARSAWPDRRRLPGRSRPPLRPHPSARPELGAPR